MMGSAPADDVHCPEGKEATAGGGGGAVGSVRPPEQGLKCPRCDSPNTKFCYYNNYSLAQPRYFCKTCRRYWTKGGALRNVPVGGGCRKSKKSKSSSTSSSATSPSSFSATSCRLSSDLNDGSPSQDLRFYHGFPPAVDFHLAGGLPFSRLHPSPGSGIFNTAAGEGGAANHLISFGDLSCSAANLPIEAAGATAAPLIGFNYPVQAVTPPFTNMGIGGGEATTSGMSLASMHSNLAASIESLSSINQGLHWKLQQQRLAMFFGGDSSQQQHHHSKGSSDVAALPTALFEGPNRPMPCQMPTSIKEACGAAGGGGGAPRKGSAVGDATSSSTTEWFLENSSTYPTPNAHSSGAAAIPTASNTPTGNNWNAIHSWTDMHQFSALP